MRRSRAYTAVGPDDDELQSMRSAMAVANIPTLLMVLVQLTGDERWLGERFQPARTRGLGDNDTGGLSSEVQAEIRDAALDAIQLWRSGRPVAIPDPSSEMLVRMMTVSTGEAVPAAYGPMMAHELGLSYDSYGLDIEMAHPPSDFTVLIIGAGVAGLCAAIRMQEAGISYTVVERNATVGGTWLQNRYPGCGVDTPNHLYSFSFAKNDWSHYFAGRDELHEYLERIATEFDVRRCIRFGTEVTDATYDVAAQDWEVVVRNTDGTQEHLRANVVISAVGAFNKPKMPAIKGLDSFQGTAVHTARWPEGGIDLEGKRVAVIGNGASAMQIVPAIADRVASLTVFQRSPQWAAPFEKFKTPVPKPIRRLLQDVPLYHAWYRIRLAWIFNDRLHEALQKDPSWPHPDRSINRINEGHRNFFIRHIVSELGDRQDLLEAVVPDYPPYGKRMLLDNGWFRTLTRETVTLVQDPITEIRSDRVVTQTGSEYEADVVILATGFDVVRFLAPMEIRGRSGRTLAETWDDDDARAYLGITIPDFPNFFCLYGPNSQTGHGGSVIFMIEIQMHYIMSLIAQMETRGIGSVECRQDIHDEYNMRVDKAHEAMVWTHPGMDVYYRNSRGRVVVNSPFRVIDFWHRARKANLDDYILEPVKVSGPVA